VDGTSGKGVAAPAAAESEDGAAQSPALPIGMQAAAGVVVTYGLVELLIKARSVLILIGLAFFIAAGLGQVVVWLTRRGLPRWAAVSVVVFTLVARDHPRRRAARRSHFRRLDNS
jgi:hypothetical protein